MRILHVDSAREWRGGQNQVLLTALGMSRRGHEVRVACQAGGVLEQRCQEADLAAAPVPFGGDLSPRAVARLVSLLREQRPERIQLHDPHAISAGLLANRLVPGAAVLATRRVDFRLRSTLSRLKYRAAHGVIAVSRAIADVLARDGVAEERVRVVHEGVIDRAPQAGGERILAQLGVPAGSPVVGNVAALTDHKDHATLLEAAAEVCRVMPAVRFVVLGEGELRPRLEARARALGLGERWIFAGFRNDLDRLIPAFTLFCLSSKLEGLGTSLLDAMCFSRPVVATGAGGIPEAVKDQETGYVVGTEDPRALAAALLRVLGSGELQAELGRAGRRRFEKHFSVERMVDQTLEAYGALGP